MDQAERCARCGILEPEHGDAPKACPRFLLPLKMVDPSMPDPERVEALGRFYACLEVSCQDAVDGKLHSAAMMRRCAQWNLDRAPPYQEPAWSDEHLADWSALG